MKRAVPTGGIDRRTFLITTAGAGLALAVGDAHADTEAEGWRPNAFVAIGPDGKVTVTVKHLEMGQGVATGLPVLVAEELEVDPAQVSVAFAPADAKRYNNLFWGPSQGTGGSTATANSWEQLRLAGAAAREMLVEAAARILRADAASLSAVNGGVVHSPSGRRLGYGELVSVAAKLTPPSAPALKPASQFRLIGRDGVKRSDSRVKSDGTAQFGADLRLPGMLTALVARPPVWGARPDGHDRKAALAVPGVMAVFPIPSGIAVAASSFWAAHKGREALNARWAEPADKVSTESLRRDWTALLGKAGRPAAARGDAEAILAQAAQRQSATYELPYLAHAPMEPLNCVVRLAPGKCEIWTGCQFQTHDQAMAAKAAGLKPEQVEIHTMLAGGSFGRRANPTSDYIVEGVEVAKVLNTPVRLMWTREDDIAGAYYRPMALHGFEAALDERGMPLAWRHRVVCQSILDGGPFAGMIKDGIDPVSVEGASNLPYAIPNLAVDLHSPKAPVPVLWWRSVGSSHTAFATECFLDELAQAGGKDPLELRRALLADQPRHLAVLELAAAKAGWGSPLPAGKGRGIAVHESFHSFVAQVVEVSIGAKGEIKVDRVVCAVDCGVAVTPDVVRAQMEGGIAFALSAALFGEITLKDGRAEQSNFHDYRCLRMNEMPRVEVHIVPSAAPPTGVGEPGVPPLAPALANAIFAATGKRLRKLPLGEQV
ncbi:xanthine dehydrogenase family protein molybdopterin-binding subunit [Paramagnetospirillum magneticum]|uniref:Aerobic-type carbon monoxide dehydrogenase, large subunit CoxL/CutL homolog n=1 Tax=Paramagnetospirillum magneticum (strain ATCC 700264 / AMB-1) TaxID=342108 RepID=Q2VZH5_PARM1|nr:xanthine dehydrogenase family protein molybdopterin-binding subunit [Paramagnetospirillum magneticum]BAE53000.1 Aerobic-type carbon monoxide dehydrogenase, large subunit CoxL/CutL homolog [Paramagnetospirillum magneticum AMB-1]